MFILVHFFIKTLSKPNKILVIIQRSNGDVLLSLPLISALYTNLNSPIIDLLVNDDTLEVSRRLPFIDKIHTFSYTEKKNNRLKQEFRLLGSIVRKYDLSICLTASDRSVLYSIFASKISIGAVEKDKSKSWWKRVLLKHFYIF